MEETEEKRLLTGNEAIARGAYEAGVRVAAAYPGTPSTEILENVAGYPEIYSQWSVNEKVALEVASGASIAGARTLVATGPRREVPIKKYQKDCQKYVMIPAYGRIRHKTVLERWKKLKKLSHKGRLNQVYKGDGSNNKTGIITSGVVFQYAMEVFPDIDILKLGMTSPIPEDVIREFARGRDTIVVIEELEPHYLIMLDTRDHMDTIEVWVEVSEKKFHDKIMDLEDFEKSIESRLYSAIGIRIKASLKEPKTIARSEGKAQRVVDRRKKD